MAPRINQLLALITAPCFILVCAIAFEIEISVYRAVDIPYQQEIFTGLGILMAVVLVPYTISRWTSLRVLKKSSRETRLFSSSFSANGNRWIILYGVMESIFSLALGVSMLILLDAAIVPATVLCIRAAENLLFVLLNQKLFGIVITPEHLVVAGRGIRIVPLKNIKMAESRYDEVHLITHIGSNKVVPVGNLNMQQQTDFFDALSTVAGSHQIFLNDNLRKLRPSF